MEDFSDIQDFDAKIKRYKRTIKILSAVVVVLGILLIFAGTRVRTIVVQSDKVNTEKMALQGELDSLLKEHNKIRTEYGDISTSLLTKDSIIQANANEIKELLAYKYDYNKIKKKLDKLRSITQGYVHQIDSLLTLNSALRKENTAIRDDLSKEKDRSSSLSKEKENLTEKVTMGSYLKAYNIKAEAVKLKSSGKEVSTEKAHRTDAVKVCFTISENPLTEPGPKTVYIRIARPDNVIVTEGTDASTFMFNGEVIQYTLKKDIDYQNKAQNICVTWKKKDRNSDAMEGTYHVAVFVDGYEIGKGSFELK